MTSALDPTPSQKRSRASNKRLDVDAVHGFVSCFFNVIRVEGRFRESSGLRNSNIKNYFRENSVRIGILAGKTFRRESLLGGVEKTD
jgi:predicted ABC-type sugar transport system permease subunit